MDVAMTKPRNVGSSCFFVSFVVGALFVIAGCGGPPKNPTWSNATGAEQYERLIWKAIREADWKNTEYHLAPTFIGSDAQGQAYDRAGWIDFWKARRFSEFSLGEVTVQPHGPDMVLTYVLHLGGTTDSANAAPGGLRVVSMWQQIKGGWVLTATSMTPIGPNQNRP